MNKNKPIEILASSRTGQLLQWLFSGGMAVLALLFIALAVLDSYPNAISAAVVFIASAIIFAPPVKAPFWVKLVLGFLLAVAT